MLTKNEKNVIRMILTSFKEDYSINEIARQCHLSPNGALKILKKLEKAGILKIKKIANIISYRINFENDKTKSILELSLIPELEGKLKFRFDDLKPLQEIVDICIIFGSYIDSKKSPQDIDIMFIIKESYFNKYKSLGNKIFQTMPIKVHEVLQTETDLKENIEKKDKVLIEILKKGIVLWGQDKLLNIIKNER